MNHALRKTVFRRAQFIAPYSQAKHQPAISRTPSYTRFLEAQNSCAGRCSSTQVKFPNRSTSFVGYTQDAVIAFKPPQIRAARRSLGRTGSWLAAWLILFVGSAFVLRDPVTLEVAVLRAMDLIDAQNHSGHDHRHAKPQAAQKIALNASSHDHIGHDHRDCPLCGAPALASGAADKIAARATDAIVSRLSNHSVLHVEFEHHGSVQSRAPPAKMNA
jgi:hypothetical protein